MGVSASLEKYRVWRKPLVWVSLRKCRDTGEGVEEELLIAEEIRRGRAKKGGEASETFLKENGFLEVFRGCFLETFFPSQAFLKQRKTFLEGSCFLTPSSSPALPLCEIERGSVLAQTAFFHGG